jgi:dipeptide/tripeptide permease
VAVQVSSPFLGFGVDVWVLFVVEFAERIAYFGVAFMLTSYTVEMLGMTTDEANYAVNALYAVSPLSSVVASGLSDGIWGRRKTLLVFGVVYTAGVALVAVSSLPLMFRDFPNGPSPESILVLILGMVLFAVGFGGMKVCTSPLEADTLTAAHRHVPLGKMFRWAYWAINFGSLFGLIGAPLLRQLDGRSKDTASGSGSTTVAHPAGFYLGFLMCTGSMLLGVLLFAGRFFHYPRNRSKASYVMFRILFRAVWIKIRFATGSLPPDAAFEAQCVSRREGGGGFLMYASYSSWLAMEGTKKGAAEESPAMGVKNELRAPEDDHDSLYNMYSVENVAELGATCRACSVFLPLPFYWLIANQFSTNVILQAAGTDLPSYFPADAFNNINTFTVLIGVAVLDKLIFPVAGQPSVRMRMLIGFFFATISMLYCGVLEVFLNQRGTFTDGGTYILAPGETELLSSWWLVPPFVTQGVASIFIDTTAMEAAYTLSAKQFKSSVFSLYLLASSASGFLGIALAPLAVPSKMVAVFFALAGMQVLVAIGFAVLQREPQQREEDLAGSPLLPGAGMEVDRGESS